MSSRDLEAVLMWDVDYLRRHRGSGSALDQFIMAMELQGQRVLEAERPPNNRSPIRQAAIALAAEVTGDDASAAEGYQRLAASGRRNVRLLGRCLLAWMPQAGIDDLEVVVEDVEALPPGALRLHLWCKLGTIALDKGLPEFSETCFDHAWNECAEEGALRHHLAWVRYAFFGHRPEFRERRWERSAFDEWFALKLGSRAMAAREANLTSLVAGPWRQTVHFGSGPTEEVAAIEMQCVWAGALWHLGEARRQLATFMLGEGSRGPGRAALGLAMWTLGGGKDLEAVADEVEPKLDRDELADLLDTQLLSGRRFGAFESYSKVVAELWDVVPESSLVELFRLTLDVDQPLKEQFGRIWNATGVRVQALWEESVSVLPQTSIRRLVSNLSPYLAEIMSEDLADRFAAAAIAAVREGNHTAVGWSVLDVLCQRTGRDPGLLDLRPHDIAELAWLSSPLVTPEVTANAALTITEQVRNLGEQALRGRMSGFGRSPFIDLGWAVSSLDSSRHSGIIDAAAQVLVSTASNPQIPRDYRMDALQALAVAIRTHGWSDIYTDLGPPESSTSAFDGFEMGGSSDSVLHAIYLGAMAFAGDSVRPQISGDILAATRDGDPRVRQLAIRAAGELREAVDVGSVVAAALWDPERVVVSEALDLLSRGPIAPEWHQSIGPRVLVLVQGGTRRVREAAARSHTGLPPDLRDAVLHLAGSDPSWLVRRQAQLSEPPDLS